MGKDLTTISKVIVKGIGIAMKILKHNLESLWLFC